MGIPQNTKRFDPNWEVSSFSQDPEWIEVRQGTAIPVKEAVTLREVADPDSTLNIGPQWEESHIPELSSGRFVCFKNSDRVALVSVYLMAHDSGKQVFSANNLPGKQFVDLQFLKEGLYTLHWVPAFTQCAQQRTLRVVLQKQETQPVPDNFHSDLQPVIPS